MNRRQKLVQQQFLDNEQAVIKRLEQVYGVALKDINAKIEKLMKRFDPDTGDLPQSVIYQIKYQEMLKAQVEGILKELQTKQFLTVSDYLNLCYEDGFVGSIFDMHGQGVPLTMPLNQESMVKAVQLDSKISKGLYTRLGEDVDLLKKKITAQVSRSIATGVSFAQTAKQLAGYTRIGYNNAIRIARTEGHRIQCSAADDAAHLAKDRGADVVKQWDSTLDGKTRESHVAVDGQIRELDEKFSNGLMFPGDPAGGAAEVINCRCAYLQRARWAVEGSFTKWNNFTKQIEEFDSPEAYDKFKKSFFSDENRKFMNYAQQMEDKYGTKDWHKILDQMTDREYKHYSKLLANNPVYNTKPPAKPVFTPAGNKTEAEDFARSLGVHADYSKYNLDVANAVNETMLKMEDTFGSKAFDHLHRVGTFPQGYSTRWKGAYVRSSDPDVDGSLWLRNVGTKTALEKLESVAKEQYGIGYWSTPEALHTIRHELGHAIHRALATPEINAELTALRKSIQDERMQRSRKGDRNHKYSDWLSDYGFTNTAEFVAESVAEYFAGNPRETASKVVEILLKGR